MEVIRKQMEQMGELDIEKQELQERESKLKLEREGLQVEMEGLKHQIQDMEKSDAAKEKEKDELMRQM